MLFQRALGRICLITSALLSLALIFSLFQFVYIELDNLVGFSIGDGRFGMWIVKTRQPLNWFHIGPVRSFASDWVPWPVWLSNPRESGFFFPLWPFILGFAGLGMGLGHTTKSLARFCRGCGYNLRGNTSGVCPECGAPVR